jgi:hypothetical protein
VTLDTILVQDSEPVSAAIENDVVLLSIRAGSYFGFNGVGTQIWNMLDEPRRIGEICDVLSQTYDVDSDTVTRDVAKFLKILLDRRLVRVANTGESR